MNPTQEKFKKRKKELPTKPKLTRKRRGNLPGQISNLLLGETPVIGLLLFLLGPIFVPPQDVSTQQDLKISALDVESEAVGPIAALEMQVLQTQGILENEYPFEFEECFQSGFVQGQLCSCIDFWRHINCSVFILDVIDNGCKILFENAPTSYSFENRGYTNKYNDFVSESILELLERGCIKEFSNPSEFCNPLHVAVQSSGKLRLILDLSHLNTMVVKPKRSVELFAMM